MPSWCENMVSVQVKSGHATDHLERFRNYVSDGKVVFSFNAIIPMPEELKRTGSPPQILDTQEEVDREIERRNKDAEKSKMPDLMRDGLVYAITKEEAEKRGNKYGYHRTPTFEHHSVTDNGNGNSSGSFRQTGYKDEPIVCWYDWACENWDTKWDAADACILDNSDEHLTYEFSTAWGPPMPIYKKLVREFPALNISWRWGGPEMGGSGFLENE